MKYYVYFLINPINDKIFYIGKGTKRRMYKHVNEFKKGIIPNNNRNLYNEIKEIINSNLDVQYKKVFESDNEIEAYAKEIELIQIVGIENLTNILNDNKFDNSKEGLSKRVIQGLNKSKKNKKRLEYIKSEEYKQKCRENNLGDKNPMYGSKWNSLQRKNIIKANKKPKTEEHKKNISKSLKEHEKTEEHKKNISKSLKESDKFQSVMKSEEYRKKQSILSSGAGNGRAKTFIFTNTENDEKFEVKGGFSKFCKENNLSVGIMKKIAYGKYKKEKFNGWTVKEK